MASAYIDGLRPGRAIPRALGRNVDGITGVHEWFQRDARGRARDDDRVFAGDAVEADAPGMQTVLDASLVAGLAISKRLLSRRADEASALSMPAANDCATDKRHDSAACVTRHPRQEIAARLASSRQSRRAASATAPRSDRGHRARRRNRLPEARPCLRRKHDRQRRLPRVRNRRCRRHLGLGFADRDRLVSRRRRGRRSDRCSLVERPGAPPHRDCSDGASARRRRARRHGLLAPSPRNREPLRRDRSPGGRHGRSERHREEARCPRSHDDGADHDPDRRGGRLGARRRHPARGSLVEDSPSQRCCSAP